MNNKQRAMRNDNKLLDLALYHESQGRTRIVTPEKVFERFMEFKKYVKRGSFTLQQLEETVYGMHGIFDDQLKQFVNALRVMAKQNQGEKNEQEQKEK